jgi:hypothetical protein
MASAKKASVPKEKRTMSLTVASNMGKLAFLAEKFPEMHVRILSSVSAFSRTMLRKDFLSGQHITYHVGETDKIGRYVVSARVIKGMKVRVSSYPLNLYERTERGHGKGRHILMIKFRMALEERIQGEAQTIYERHLERALKEFDL